MSNIVKIKSIGKITHDVLQIVAEKPAGLVYHPGQAADLSINQSGWEKEVRPFTFTSLPADDHIEFTIKTYPLHNGVTNQLLQVKEGDELLLGDVFGEIAYKGEGVFIAGGAGITPFISIFRDLQSKGAVENNKLLFANKTKADIIHEKEFKELLGKNFINIISDENAGEYMHGHITADLLKQYISNSGQYIYLCGPPPMMDAIEKQLADLHVAADRIIKEGF